MKTITQMREEIKALVENMGNLKALAEAENRSLTAKEDTFLNDSMNQIDVLKRDIATEERLQATNDALSMPTTTVVYPEPNGTTEDRSLITIEENRDRFSSFGEQMMSVYKAADPAIRTVDPRLNIRAATGLNETVPSDGGFLVQQDFASEILKQVFETGILAPKCRNINISGNANSTTMNGIDETSRATGSRYGGVQAYWAGEADEKTASKPKFRRIELNLKKLIGLCYATDENLQDAAQLEGVIKEAFVNEFGFMVDDAIINGTGAGQPRGILTGGNNKPTVQVAKESGQGAATIVYENVSNMWSRLFASSRGNAVWLINQDTEPQLNQMSIAIGTSGIPVFMPASGISGAPYSTLYGRPVIPLEQCQTLGTAGDIILADMSGYMLAKKAGIKQDMSIHVRFIYDESVFRFVLKVDGQPVLENSITPKNSSATLSHFVKLQTRS